MPVIMELLVIILLTAAKGTGAVSFMVLNNCGYSIWPGFLSDAGIAPLATTGLELLPGTTRVVETPARWSGRLWGGTGCNFGAEGKGNCVTGDCGGQVQSNGAGTISPVSPAEFTLDLADLDFYDVSLVVAYCLPPLVVANRGTGAYMGMGCIVDINLGCPELQLDGGNDNVLDCKSACEAFDSPRPSALRSSSCNRTYAHPNTCKPSAFSQFFKSACPCAHSHTFDDKTSTFTCMDADYAVTFCPTVAMASQKGSTDTPLVARPIVSAGTSNANGPPKIIIGGSKVTSTAVSPTPTSMPAWTSIKVTSPAVSSMPTWTSILISLLLELPLYWL